MSFLMRFHNVFRYIANIKRFLLLQANLSLRGCFAMCLIFQENPGSRAYKLVAYKKKCVTAPAYNRQIGWFPIEPLNRGSTVVCVDDVYEIRGGGQKFGMGKSLGMLQH